MSDAGSTESSSETAAETADSHATGAFSLLGNETRLEILLAIWEANDPRAADDSVPFSRIFERVDHDDPGNVRYHLEKLRERFVRQRSDRGGYELRFPAEKIVRAVIAGAGIRDETLPATEIDQACPLCGASTTMSYRQGVLFWSCTDCAGVAPDGDPPGEPTTPGPLSALPFDPAAVADWTPEELRAASMVAGERGVRSMFDGVCPSCSGPVEGWFEPCPDHEPAGNCEECELTFAHPAWFQCRTCEHYLASRPRRLALLHPSVVSFYDDHGISTRVRADDFESAKRVYDLVLDHEVELAAEDPTRVAVTASMDGDAVRVVFDETVRVTDVRR